MKRSVPLVFLLMVGLACSLQPLAAETAEKPSGGEKPLEQKASGPEKEPASETFVTRHSMRLDGAEIRYTATAGTLLIGTARTCA